VGWLGLLGLKGGMNGCTKCKRLSLEELEEVSVGLELKGSELAGRVFWAEGCPITERGSSL